MTRRFLLPQTTPQKFLPKIDRISQHSFSPYTVLCLEEVFEGYFFIFLNNLLKCLREERLVTRFVIILGWIETAISGAR